MWPKCIFLLFLSVIIPILTSKLMYSLVHERAELLSYNESLVSKEVKFGFRKVNRTSFGFNVSFTTRYDFIDKKLMLGINVDKLFGNEYKRTGTTIMINMCKFWEKNMFGIRNEIQSHGNLEACNVKKGSYYLRNFVPDENMFPRFLPFGSYRIEITALHHEAELFRMYWFSRVEQLIQ